jgi:hypothetical protein
MPRSSFWGPCAALLLFTASAFGQSQNASLAGQVTDPSGAFVPNASVTVSSTERQISSTIHTDSDGRYSFPNLNPGTYDLSVEAPGFKGYVQRKIELSANQTAPSMLVWKSAMRRLKSRSPLTSPN